MMRPRASLLAASSCALLSTLLACDASRIVKRRSWRAAGLAPSSEPPPGDSDADVSIDISEDPGFLNDSSVGSGITMRTGQAKFVAIGDSYSSGAGVYTDPDEYEGGGCFRAWERVPGAKYAAEHGMTFINKACANTEAETVYTYIDRLADEYPEEIERNWEGAVFQVTSGGNDVRTRRGDMWQALLVRCLTAAGCSRESENEMANFDEVQETLTQLYSRLAGFASAAKIRVMGYPLLLQNRVEHCFGVPALGRLDAGWLDRVTENLNKHIVAAVQAVRLANPGVDIEFASLQGHLTEGACTESESDRQINGLVFSDRGSESMTISPATLHPTAAGYSRVLEVLEASLAPRPATAGDLSGSEINPEQ